MEHPVQQLHTLGQGRRTRVRTSSLHLPEDMSWALEADKFFLFFRLDDPLLY
jgi:hypothetical protein